MRAHRTTPGKRHEYYLELRAKGYYQSACECGGRKSRSAKRCVRCGNANRKSIGRRPKDSRAGSGLTCSCGKPRSSYGARCKSCATKKFYEDKKAEALNPFCPNPREVIDVCSANYEHHHCACGLPIKPTEFACSLCIYEQARVERAMAGKRFNGDALEDAA